MQDFIQTCYFWLLILIILNIKDTYMILDMIKLI
jgi:hypothetical protein